MTTGSMTVATGPMRSRKTLELIIEAQMSEIAGVPTLVFYPAGAERWGDQNAISSRLGVHTDGTVRKMSYPATPIAKNLDDIFAMVPDKPSFIGFDDAQFFSNNIVSVCRKLIIDGHRVYVAGLDLDCFLQPFGPMPYLMAMANKVRKHTAVCVDCKDPATVSYRLSDSEDQEIVGDDEYVPLCIDCYKYRIARTTP